MTFSSPLFVLCFLPCCLIGYSIFARLGRRGMVSYLALISLAFYAAWNWHYLVVLLLSIGMNFLLSVRIAATRESPRRQSAWLIAGILLNLAGLVYYKYLFPFLTFLHLHGVLHRDEGSVILPLGISFFTFTQIAYLIDLKQGAAGRESIGSYTLFVTFFPHLIAGPILHHKEMMPQFRQERSYKLNNDDLALGITWFTLGFCKKLLIADQIAPVADALFASPSTKGFEESWVGALMYAMQLYFDFSGYSDMAIGLARMFSIRFPMNFDSPFKAENIIDFWQRWHMTLTHYIMSYLYAPLQMKVSRWRIDHGKKVSRKAQATLEGVLQMVLFPTMLTMFIAGLWHGAGKQFVAYGLMHGVFLCSNHLWRIFVPESHPLRRLMTRPAAIGLTFLAVVSTFIMFRASGVGDALRIYAGMLGRHGAGAHTPGIYVLQIVALMGAVWLLPNTQELLGQSLRQDPQSWSILPGLRWQPSPPWLLITATGFLFCIAYSAVKSTFLYFQF